MAKPVQKKAKLAHEKNQRGGGAGEDSRAFTPNRIVETIDFEGKPSVVVELDDKGTLGIIDRVFVTTDAAGNQIFRAMACPAIYDSVAQGKAIAKYGTYSSAQA